MGEQLHVRLIGVPTIETSLGDTIDVRGQKPWAVLARVLLADRPVTRRELSTALFSEAADPLGALRWCLASLRKSLGNSEILVGDPISRELPSTITVDVLSLDAGSVDRLAVGQLLEGVDPACGPEFDTWLLVTRQQVASRIDALVREATITAMSRGDHARALQLADEAARRLPFDEGPQVLLVKALTMAGHGDAALRHVEQVETLFRSELGCEPSGALRSAARSSIAAEPPGISAETIVSSLLDSGRAAISAGAIDAGIDCLRRAGARAESTSDDALIGRCWLELGTALVHSIRGYDDEGSVLLEQSFLRASAAGDLGTAVAALRERGYVDALAGRRPQADHRLTEAADLAAAEPSLLAPVSAVSGLNLSDWGRHGEALAKYEATIEMARRTGDRRWEGWAFGLGAWAALSAGRVDQAVEWSAACERLVDALQWRSFAPWPWSVAAAARLAAGSVLASEGELERCFAVSCELEDPCWEGASGRVLALHHASVGDLDTALDWIVQARSRAVRKSDTWVAMIAEILLVETEIRRAVGDDSGADAAARELVGVAARAHLDELLVRAVPLLSVSPGLGAAG